MEPTKFVMQIDRASQFLTVLQQQAPDSILLVKQPSIDQSYTSNEALSNECAHASHKVLASTPESEMNMYNAEFCIDIEELIDVSNFPPILEKLTENISEIVKMRLQMLLVTILYISYKIQMNHGYPEDYSPDDDSEEGDGGLAGDITVLGEITVLILRIYNHHTLFPIIVEPRINEVPMVQKADVLDALPNHVSNSINQFDNYSEMIHASI
ncbi:hypothetical protein QAD02_017552 [Eretmocerus hayati]|uniref:Uncharacterized protein n=1 Tax=Eretmocerus hayati TaxID=131215 RepID=A0ACC2PDX3_9HYME|nr:hypothetical protein QAD02_017552 [Eretmocerus hayati]